MQDLLNDGLLPPEARTLHGQEKGPIMLAKKVRLHDLRDEEQVLAPTYGQRLLRKS